MGNFNRGGRDRGFGGDRNRGRGFGNDREREMFQTTCSNCGRTCEVPFRPTGEKPVYCNDCFSEIKDSDGGRSKRSEFGGGRDGGFRERNNRRQENKPSGGNNEVQKQLAEVSSKLDKLIAAVERLSSVSAPKPTTSKTVVAREEVIEEKPAKKVVKKKTATKSK